MPFMRLAFCLSALVLAAFPGSAQTIETEAEFAVILDYDTGEVLYSKNGNEPMVPASMTKIMTAHVVYDHIEKGELSLEDRFTVSERAWREGGWATGGSTMGLEIGEQPTVEELLRGVVVLSGNDACIVLAEGISGTEEAFAREMTRVAQEMGLKTANFENASGLYADNHRISAIDLARLAQQEIKKFPQFYKYYSEREMSWNGITQQNRNPLLGTMEGADGLKTGHLEISGYGLTASAVRDGERRIIVLNGLPSISSRASEGERMMRLAFAAFERRRVEADGAVIASLDVWNGKQAKVDVVLAEPLSVAGQASAFDTAKSEIVLSEPLIAPIQEGQVIGSLAVTLDGRSDPVLVPVKAASSVEKLGFLDRAIAGLGIKLDGGN